MTRPKCLDLFCGPGGTSMGYYQAGYDVVGVDTKPQPRYPFPFILADATSFDLEGYDLIHASPPCQSHTAFNTIHRNHIEYTSVLSSTLERLQKCGTTFVVENVPGSEHLMPEHIVLCGTMFGLKVRRHRLFVSNSPLPAPGVCSHSKSEIPFSTTNSGTGWYPNVESRFRDAMEVPWMLVRESRQAIPPAYTRWIGQHLLGSSATDLTRPGMWTRG